MVHTWSTHGPLIHTWSTHGPHSMVHTWSTWSVFNALTTYARHSLLSNRTDTTINSDLLECAQHFHNSDCNLAISEMALSILTDRERHFQINPLPLRRRMIQLIFQTMFLYSFYSVALPCLSLTNITEEWNRMPLFSIKDAFEKWPRTSVVPLLGLHLCSSLMKRLLWSSVYRHDSTFFIKNQRWH